MSVATSAEPLECDRRVCAWLGEHKIVEHISDLAYAANFEAAMRRRFLSLRVTNRPVVASDTAPQLSDVRRFRISGIRS
jgi:hypothetical protein